MGGERILLIEDDASVALFFSRTLQQAGYTTTIASTGASGIKLAQEIYPDLILLDLIMPDIHGLDLCQLFRRHSWLSATPLVIVTSCAKIDQCVAGLNAGADDYITKPLIADELCARVRAQLRRAPQRLPAPQAQLVLLDHTTNMATIEGHCLRLTLREYQLLNYLMHHAGSVCSQEQLLHDVWSYPPEYADPGLVRWQIRKLRERIEPDPKCPRYIHTVKQRGYMYRDPSTISDPQMS